MFLSNIPFRIGTTMKGPVATTFLLRPAVVSAATPIVRTHYTYASPGQYHGDRHHHHRTDWKNRGFTVGIGGPVGSGKTALVLALTQRLKEKVPRECFWVYQSLLKVNQLYISQQQYFIFISFVMLYLEKTLSF